MVRVGNARSICETVEGADAEFHVIEGKESRMPDWDIAKLMRRAAVFMRGLCLNEGAWKELS